jgi:leader peptidase (prepilin peptidase)/N-methyltransferase
LFEIIGVIILGLLIGSFINVIIARIVNDNDNIYRPSRCPNCKSQIPWNCNIPIFSFIFLKGKCPKCKLKISFIYPLVETLSAITFFICYQQYGLSLDFLFSLIFFLGLLIIFFTDFKYFLIFDSITLPLTAIGIVLTIFSLNPFNIKILDSIFGALIGYGLIFSIRWIYFKVRNIEGMGLGDAKLFLALGAWLGFQSLLFILFVSSFLGSIYGYTYILIAKKNKNVEIAYGCFIILAVVLYQFFSKNFYNFINHIFML